MNTSVEGAEISIKRGERKRGESRTHGESRESSRNNSLIFLATFGIASFYSWRLFISLDLDRNASQQSAPGTKDNILLCFAPCTS
jgi:hypothetical protein